MARLHPAAGRGDAGCPGKPPDPCPIAAWRSPPEKPGGGCAAHSPHRVCGDIKAHGTPALGLPRGLAEAVLSPACLSHLSSTQSQCLMAMRVLEG